jgi:hypothetical protein
LLFSLNPNEFLNSAELSNCYRLLSAARIGSHRGLNAGQRLGVAAGVSASR